MRGWVACAALTLLAACGPRPEAPQEREVTIAGYASPPIQEGTPTLLSENYGELCIAVPPRLRNRPEFRELSAAMAVRMPRIGVDWDEQYFVVVKGQLSDLGRFGHQGLCSREIVVEEVQALRPMSADEQHAQCVLRRPSCLMTIPESDRHFCECAAAEEEAPAPVTATEEIN
jgi:hypothetical protein